MTPSQEERENNIADMKLRIFDTVKQLEDDFIYNIKESFDEAAVDAEQRAIEKQLKLEAAA